MLYQNPLSLRWSILFWYKLISRSNKVIHWKHIIENQFSHRKQGTVDNIQWPMKFSHQISYFRAHSCLWIREILWRYQNVSILLFDHDNIFDGLLFSGSWFGCTYSADIPIFNERKSRFWSVKGVVGEIIVSHTYYASFNTYWSMKLWNGLWYRGT